MLEIDVQDLRRGALEWDETVSSPGDVWPDVPGEFRGPVRLHARAEAVGGGQVHVTGRLEGTIAVECRRCLRETEQGLAVDLDVLFLPEDAPDGGAESDDAEAVFGFGGRPGIVDLVPALREELFLAAPPYPLCDPECGGLCPKCGAVRDEEECGCVLEEPDPRWDTLRELETG